MKNEKKRKYIPVEILDKYFGKIRIPDNATFRDNYLINVSLVQICSALSGFLLLFLFSECIVHMRLSNSVCLHMSNITANNKNNH